MESTRVLSDRYALITHLARGGMADVWIAEDRRLGRRVAVKILHGQYAESEAFVERFRREAQAAANLSHANVVAVYDWGQDGDTYFMVMELVQGRNLRDVLRSEGALLPRRVAEIGAEVGVAVSVAHSQGLVHRDIKPANVLLTPDGAVKVADFGIARAWDDSEQLTKTGAVIGTATYFSPEQAQGHTADARSDIYSIGVVMYELLTGVPPFSGESPVAVAYQHVQENPRPPSQLNPDIPPGLEAIVLKAMAKHPEDRYQSAVELVEDVDRLLAGQVPLAAPQNEAPTRVMSTAVPPPPVTDAGPGKVGRKRPIYAEPDRTDRTTLTIGIIAAMALLVLGIVLLARLLGAESSANLVTIPDVRGLQAADASSQLGDLGLTVEERTIADEELAVGIATGTDPAAGTEIEEGSAVTLLVSGGIADVTVPDVVDVGEAEARQAIEAAGLEVGNIEFEASPVIAAGTVISQTPSGGDLVASGSQVDLVISAGANALTVPDVVGKSESDALFTLSQVGFGAEQVRIERQPSADVLEGFVIETSPEAGQLVPTNGFVTVVISEGAVPSVVPSVITMQPGDAQQLLEDLGFVVLFDDPLPLEFGDPLDGVIAEQSPAAGETAEFGSTIRLRIGEAATDVEVPDVLGSDEDTVRQQLEALGLVFNRGLDIELGLGNPNDGLALEQTPPPGTTIAIGSLVTVRFGAATLPPTVPDLVGDAATTCLTQAQAEEAILAAGLVPSRGADIAVVFGDPCNGKVVAQSPDPLVVVETGSVVTYQIGVASSGVILDQNQILGFLPGTVQSAFDTLTWTQHTPDGTCMTSDAGLHGRIAWIDPVPGSTVPDGTEITYWLGDPTLGPPCSQPPTP